MYDVIFYRHYKELRGLAAVGLLRAPATADLRYNSMFIKMDIKIRLRQTKKSVYVVISFVQRGKTKMLINSAASLIYRFRLSLYVTIKLKQTKKSVKT